MDEIIFVGAFPGHVRGGVKFVEGQSRCYRQPYRVHSPQGIHPAISSQEPEGRYWILIEL